MAKSVKIIDLVSELESEFPVLVSCVDLEKLKTMQNAMAQSFLAGIEAYMKAKLTAQEKKELAAQEKALENLQVKHDKIKSEYMVLHAATIGDTAKELAEDPLAMVQAMVKLESERSDEIDRLDSKRAEDSEKTTQRIAELSQKKTMAALAAMKTYFKYTDDTNKTTSHKIGEAEFAIVDLLKKATGHAVLYVNKDRVLEFSPINADWAARGFPSVDAKNLPEWYAAGSLADTPKLQRQTALQQFCWEWQNRYDSDLTPEENTARVNKIFEKGSPKSIGTNGQCGGTANVHRVVTEITEGQGRQIKRSEWVDVQKYGYTYPEPEVKEEKATA